MFCGQIILGLLATWSTGPSPRTQTRLSSAFSPSDGGQLKVMCLRRFRPAAAAHAGDLATEEPVCTN